MLLLFFSYTNSAKLRFLSLFLLTRGSQTPIIPIKLLGIVSGDTDYEAML